MTFENLLVVLNNAQASENVLRMAVQLRDRFDTHITAILAHENSNDLFERRQWLPENVRGVIEDAVTDDAVRVETRFRELFDHVRSDKVHWLPLADDANMMLAQYASLFDLMIAGRQMLQDSNKHPERIAVKSGRPVLVVPPGNPGPLLTERPAVIAWDGMRAATRALNDALPLLGAGQTVHVVSSGSDVRQPLEGMNVVTTLARHGIEAVRVRRDMPSRSIGPELLRYCEEVNAGFLAIGAFEQSIFREDLFGGTTKHVLSNAPMPVLISH